MKDWQREYFGFIIVFSLVTVIVVFSVIEQLNQNL